MDQRFFATRTTIGGVDYHGGGWMLIAGSNISTGIDTKVLVSQSVYDDSGTKFAPFMRVGATFDGVPGSTSVYSRYEGQGPSGI